jgi:sphingomyelin phosphodiesterase acid-like 3
VRVAADPTSIAGASLTAADAGTITVSVALCVPVSICVRYAEGNGYAVIAILAALVMHWLVLNDIHLNPYDSGPPASRGEDTNTALFDTAVDEMRRRVPDAQVIVVGGDLLAHHFSTLAHRAHRDPYAAGVSTVAGIASKLDKAFPNAQFLFAVGNNDDPCGDYRSEAGGPYTRVIARIFAPLVNRHGASPGFVNAYSQGAYYSSALPGGMRAVVTNSVFWSFFFRGSCQVGVRDPGGKEMQWLAQTLAHGENVVIMHMPLGYDPESTTTAHRLLAVPFLRTEYDSRIRKLFANDRERVPFAIAGHTHRYDFRVPGGVPMLVAASLSPIYHNLPAFFELDVEGDTLRDVIPYTYDPALGWIKQQSFDAMFGVTSFTAPELGTASQRIASDPEIRSRWIQAYDVWGYYIGDVSDHRWQTYQCAEIAFGDSYARCAGTYVQSVMNVVAGAAGLIVAVIAATLIFVTWRNATPSS